MAPAPHNDDDGRPPVGARHGVPLHLGSFQKQLGGEGEGQGDGNPEDQRAEGEGACDASDPPRRGDHEAEQQIGAAIERLDRLKAPVVVGDMAMVARHAAKWREALT